MAIDSPSFAGSPQVLRQVGKNVHFPENVVTLASKSILKRKIDPLNDLDDLSKFELCTKRFSDQFQQIVANPHDREAIQDCATSLLTCKQEVDPIQLLDQQQKRQPQTRKLVQEVRRAYILTDVPASLRNKIPTLIKTLHGKLVDCKLPEIVKYLVLLAEREEVDVLALLDEASFDLEDFSEFKELILKGYSDACKDDTNQLVELLETLDADPTETKQMLRIIYFLKRASHCELDPFELLDRALEKAQVDDKDTFKQTILIDFMKQPEGISRLIDELSELLRRDIVDKWEAILTKNKSSLVAQKLIEVLGKFEVYEVDTGKLLLRAWHQITSQCRGLAKGIALGNEIITSVKRQRTDPQPSLIG